MSNKFYSGQLIVKLAQKRSIFSRLLIVFLIAFGLGSNFNDALSWSFGGHVLISQIAYNKLSVEKKIIADQCAQIIYSKLSQRQKHYLAQHYSKASYFARLSALPDTWRNKTLSQIYQRFRAPLPKILQPIRDETTNNWHFISQGYPNERCKFNQERNVVWAIHLMTLALQQTKDRTSKAVSLILLAHYVGDIHQPLHTITHTTKMCLSDFGGNKHIIKANEKKLTNLHKLWDRGVGYIQSSFNVEKKALFLKEFFQQNKISSKLNEKNANHWAQDNYRYAPFIYSIKPYNTPTVAYRTKAKGIVRYQIILAGYRLADLLNRKLN